MSGVHFRSSHEVKGLSGRSTPAGHRHAAASPKLRRFSNPDRVRGEKLHAAGVWD
jgi:hypothetical protein